MDKLLEASAWRHMTLSVGPSLLFVGSLTVLLGLLDLVPEHDEVQAWILGLTFVLAIVIVGMVLEELTSRFESKVDDWLYPCMRARCKLFQAMEPKRFVHPDTYMHRFNVTWERYLDLVPPAEKPQRWSYYSALLHRYKAIMAFGMSSLLTSLVWLYLGTLAVARGDIAVQWMPPGLVVVIGGCLLAISVYALFVEVPSSAWLLHWHRVRLIRSTRLDTAARGRPRWRPFSPRA